MELVQRIKTSFDNYTCLSKKERLELVVLVEIFDILNDLKSDHTKLIYYLNDAIKEMQN